MGSTRVYVHVDRDDKVKADWLPGAGDRKVQVYLGKVPLLGDIDDVMALLDEAQHQIVLLHAGGDKRFGDPTDGATYVTLDVSTIDDPARALQRHLPRHECETGPF